MSDERLRLVAELQNNASAELQKLRRDMGTVKPSAGMMQAKTWFTQLSAASDMATKSVRPLASGLNVIGAGGLAAGLSIAGLTRQFVDLAKALPALQELSRQTGMSTTEIERLKAAASNLSVDPSKMQASLSGFSRMMVDFHRRHGDLYEEMVNHGAAGLAEKIRQEDPAAAYRDVLKWLDAIPEAQRRAGKSAADAAQIQRHWAGQAFGDEDMAQLVAKGMGSFEDAYRQASRDVKEITKEAIEAATAFDRSIASFERTWKDFETSVGPTVFDNLRHATDDFRKVFDTIKGTMSWFGGHKDHPLKDAQDAALSAIDAQAAYNKAHPEGIIVDVPGLVSKGIHALTDWAHTGSSPAVPVPAGLRPMPSTADDRTRVAATVKAVTAELGNGASRPAALHPAALGAAIAAGVPGDTVAAAVKAGTLEALREWAAMQDLDAKGSGGGFGGGGGGTPNMRYGRGAGGGYRGTPGGGTAFGGGDGGTASWRNNNPGNIGFGPFAREHGADGHSGRWAHFPSYAVGRKAQEDLWFNSDRYRGLTLAQGVGKWSPPSENDTASIIRDYAAATGLDPNTPLSSFTPEQRAKLLDAQQAREGWRAGTRGNSALGVSAVTAAMVKDDTPEVAAARKYLAETATGAATIRADSISKLNPAFALKAAEAIRQARAAGMTGAGIFSGYRRPDTTGSRYDMARLSGHIFGIAADFAGIGTPGSAASRRFDQITRGVGLGGYGPDNGREFNHKELFNEHLEHLPPLLARLQATLGRDGGMIDPAATWAAAGVPLPKMKTPTFPEVVKALPPEMAKRTLTAFLAPVGKPGQPTGMPGDEPVHKNPAIAIRTLARYIRVGRSFAAQGELPLPNNMGPAFMDPAHRQLAEAMREGAKAQAIGLDPARQKLADAMRGGASGQPIKVEMAEPAAAMLAKHVGTHVGHQLPAWMQPGANGPLRTFDMRDPKFAPKAAPLPVIAPEPPARPAAGPDRRAEEDESHLHVHLHQDGRVRAVRSGSPGVRLHLDTGRTFTQFA